MKLLNAVLVLGTFGLIAASGQPSYAAGQSQTNGGGQSMGPGMMLEMPMMNPARGRELFASKGCVVCHSINGVGGTDAPKLDASTMKPHMNPFDFSAKMWRGAQAMIAMQNDELGGQIEFTGQELADIIAFAHDPQEQKKFSEADIPARIKKLMEGDEDSGGGEMKGEGSKGMMGNMGKGMKSMDGSSN